MNTDAKQLRSVREDAVMLRRLLSHDFRMPMAVISGYGALLLEEGYDGSEESRAIVTNICKNIEYMNTLLKVLLDDEGEHVLEDRSRFDLLECIREGVGYVRTIARRQGVSVQLNSSQSMVPVYGNRIKLLRAFFNLVENSLKYMKRKGTICITVEQTEDAAYVIYKDDGVGMDAAEASHAAELNYQGANRSGGYGIGLFLVRDMVDDFGGTMEIHSHVGQGMRICLTFPLGRAQTETFNKP
jgi:signal transduction histidine kinase